MSITFCCDICAYSTGALKKYLYRNKPASHLKYEAKLPSPKRTNSDTTVSGYNSNNNSLCETETVSPVERFERIASVGQVVT